jgi:ribonuclease D
MPVQYIDRAGELESVTNKLSAAKQIAVDLEFDKNYYRYGFNLCLIQIYDGDTCYLIDPISKNLDIKTIYPVLEDDTIEKVTFAFGEDLRLLHSMRCFPKNIYDLDIASSLLNYPPASLVNLINDILGVDTGKSSQLSNWYNRPLTDQQIHYAAQDVLHLLDLKEVLIRQAKQKNISEWIAEENSAWDHLDYSDELNNGILKEKDKKDFNEVEWHIFSELMEYREKIAHNANKPSFQIIKKEYLMEVAKDSRTLMNWDNEKGIYRKIKNEKTKSDLIEIVKEARRQADEIGLSESEPAKKLLTPDEMKQYKKQQKRLREVKSAFFDPIKKKIEEEYGQETAVFLFSNRIISDLVNGENGYLENYKKELLAKYTDELNLNKDILERITDFSNS